MLKLFNVFFLILLMTGCFKREPSSVQICDTYPSVCLALNVNDGQCDKERVKLIHHRFATLQNPTEFTKFDELLVTKEYANCMEISVQFDVATLNSKKAQRIKAQYHAYDSIKLIESELKNSHQPEIIYYRWTQGDQDALALFLALENTEYLDTPSLQFGLATYYINRDKAHTINILHKSLSLYDGKNKKVKEEILPEIIKTLATTNHAQGKLEQAYFWALIAKQFDVPVVGKEELERMYPLAAGSSNQIEALALSVAKKIKQGQFNPSLLNWLEM